MAQETTKWYRMDNSGMIYPIIATLSNQSNFCLSFALDRPVDPDLLTQSLQAAYGRFPYYKVKIERGLFRPYLADNPNPVRVWPADGVLLGRTDYVKNGYFPIMVSYWQDNVYVTFFHGLGDGTAATIFVRYLVCAYLQRRDPDLGVDADSLFPPCDNETENAYDTFYTNQPFWKGLHQTSGGNAAQVKGTFFVEDGLGCIEGRIPLSTLLTVTRKMGCTITELMAAAAMLAGLRTRVRVKPNQPPKVFIPVNLRPLYGSNTMLNFVGMAKCVLPQTDELAPCIEAIHTQLRAQCTREAFLPKLAFASLFSKNPLLRNFPLGVKVGVSKLARRLAQATKQTMIVSNVGKLALPEAVLPHVHNFSFLLNCNRRTPFNVAMLSVGDIFTVTCTRHIVQTDIEREFFGILRELGLDFVISSNYREVPHAV